MPANLVKMGGYAHRQPDRGMGAVARRHAVRARRQRVRQELRARRRLRHRRRDRCSAACALRCDEAMRLLAGCVAALLAAGASAARAAVVAVDDTGATVKLAAPAHAHREPRAARDGAPVRGRARAIAIVGVARHVGLAAARRSDTRVSATRARSTSSASSRSRPTSSSPGRAPAPAQVEALRARGIAVFIDEARDDRRHRAGHRAAGRAAGHAADAAARGRGSSARGSRACASRYARRRDGARVLRDLGRAALHDRRRSPDHAGDRACAAARTSSPRCRCRRRRVERRGGARRDSPTRSSPAPIAAVRPAWLDAWKRWTELPAVAHGNLFAVDANLLHRPGPRFVDGVAPLCAAIDRARLHDVTASATASASLRSGATVQRSSR